MGLSITLNNQNNEDGIYFNITHNLNVMASECGLYQPLWSPEPLTAGEIVADLEDGIRELACNKGKYEVYNPVNGWGDYDALVRFTTAYIQACKENPEAIIEIHK